MIIKTLLSYSKRANHKFELSRLEFCHFLRSHLRSVSIHSNDNSKQTRKQIRQTHIMLRRNQWMRTVRTVERTYYGIKQDDNRRLSSRTN